MFRTSGTKHSEGGGSEPSIPDSTHPALLSPGETKTQADGRNTVFHPGTAELTSVREQCAADTICGLLQTSSRAITGYPRLCHKQCSGHHYSLSHNELGGHRVQVSARLPSGIPSVGAAFRDSYKKNNVALEQAREERDKNLDSPSPPVRRPAADGRPSLCCCLLHALGIP